MTLHVSGIYMPIFRSIRLYTLYTFAYGVPPNISLLLRKRLPQNVAKDESFQMCLQ